MTTLLNGERAAGMLRAAAGLLKANRDLLSQLDSATGDGDHGATMSRVADAILESIVPGAAPAVGALFESAGWNVLSVDGGSASPLVGSFLMGMAEGCPAAPLDGAGLAGALEAGLAKFRAQTPAKVGDKTMLDALAPAVQTARAVADQGFGPAEMLKRAAGAARQGAESTRELQAKFGRARNLGARSIGHADPGATSIALLFQGFAAAFEAGN